LVKLSDERKAQFKAEAQRILQEKNKELTFAPNVQTNPEIKIEYSGEQKNVIRRLSTTMCKKPIEELEKIKEQLDLKDCTFKPTTGSSINPEIKIEYSGEQKNVIRRLSTTTNANAVRSSADVKDLKPELNKKDTSRIFNTNTTSITPSFSETSQTPNLSSVFQKIEQKISDEIQGMKNAETNSTFKFSMKPSNLVTNIEVPAKPDKSENKKSSISKPLSASVNPIMTQTFHNNLSKYISKNDFLIFTKEIKLSTKFSPSIRIVIEALLTLLEMPPVQNDKDSVESVMKKLLQKGNVYENLSGVKFSKDVCIRLESFKSNATFNPSLIAKNSKASASLCSWILFELNTFSTETSPLNKPSVSLSVSKDQDEKKYNTNSKPSTPNVQDTNINNNNLNINQHLFCPFNDENES
jgi:hypothetical protein